MNLLKTRRQIEGVMSLRCPAKIDPKTRRRFPWQFLSWRNLETCQQIAFEVPNGYAARDLMQETDALAAAVGSPIEITDRVGAVVVTVFRSEFPALVEYTPNLLMLTEGRAVVLGMDRTGRPVFHSFRVPHLLVAGMSGSGKTDFIRWVLLQLIHHFPPENLSIDIIDMKGFSFLPFRGVPHIRRIVRDLAGAVDVLSQAREMMTLRSEMVWNDGRRDSVQGFRWHIVLIDEAAQIAPLAQRDPIRRELAQQADTDAAAISAIGREASVGLIYATQRPDANVLNPLVKANMEASVCFRTKTRSNSEIIIDKPGAELLTNPGRAIYAAGNDTHIQVPYIGDDDAWNLILDPYRKEVPPDAGNENPIYTGLLD